MGKKYILPLVLILSILSIVSGGCNSSEQSVTFAQLTSQADKYNGKSVTVEAFYFSGFEISVISESVGPASSGVWRIVPTGTLVWVEEGISQEVQNKLYTQTGTPSGYAEHIGKLKITGKFETDGRYGHLDAYQYQISLTNAELLDWTPPPAYSTPTNGDLQIKVTDLSGMPLQGAKVVSEEQPDRQLKVTGLTDTNGTVIFNDIESGNYRFFISHVEYVQTEVTVTVTSGQIQSITVKMALFYIPVHPQAAGIGGWQPPRPLTEDEKTRVVEIALNSPEASAWCHHTYAFSQPEMQLPQVRSGGTDKAQADGYSARQERN